jgi:hypothetical protein
LFTITRCCMIALHLWTIRSRLDTCFVYGLRRTMPGRYRLHTRSATEAWKLEIAVASLHRPLFSAHHLILD